MHDVTDCYGESNAARQSLASQETNTENEKKKKPTKMPNNFRE